MAESKEHKKNRLSLTKEAVEYTLSVLNLVQHLGRAWRIEDILGMVIRAQEEAILSHERQLKELEDGVPNS